MMDFNKKVRNQSHRMKTIKFKTHKIQIHKMKIFNKITINKKKHRQQPVVDGSKTLILNKMKKQQMIYKINLKKHQKKYQMKC